MMLHLHKRYLNWLSALDSEQLNAITDIRVWCLIIITFISIIFVAGEVPVTSDFFHLQTLPALACLIPVVVAAILVGVPSLRNRIPHQVFGVILLGGSATFQFFMWSLVCFSELPGSTVLAALPILLAAYHGEFFQFSARYPWGGLTTLSAVSAAFIISPDTDHHAIIAVGGLIALGAAATMGNHAEIRNRAIKERDALKAAVDAQTLLDSVREVEQAQNVVSEIRGTNHDAGNALSGILMNLDFLVARLSQAEISQSELEETREIAADLDVATKRLRSLIEQGREAGKNARSAETVHLDAVAELAINDARICHPAVSYQLNNDKQPGENGSLKLHGGELTLHRILTNLLINSAEGNGQQHARNVTLSITAQADHLQFTITDDGPGFSTEQVNHSLANIKTTKEMGTGLGLYTTQRLIQANRGKLHYGNGDRGGAVVSVTLPKSDRP